MKNNFKVILSACLGSSTLVTAVEFFRNIDVWRIDDFLFNFLFTFTITVITVSVAFWLWGQLKKKK